MNFAAKIVFNNINHGHRAAIYIEEKFFVGASVLYGCGLLLLL